MVGVTSGVIESLKRDSREPPFVLEVKDLKRADGGRCQFLCTDGNESIKGAFVGAHLVNLVDSAALKKGSLVKVTGCSTNTLQGEVQLFITALDLVGGGSTLSASGQDSMQGVETHDTKSPVHTTPSPKTLSSNIEIFSGKANLSPLQALNPYGRDWKLKAKVVHKFNKQSYSTKNGEDCSRFSAHIVDEHGTQAEITFWREVADKYFDSLQEKKVYIFSRFTVKPANKNYSSLSFDYALNMGQRSEVHECVDQDIMDIEEKIDAIQLTQLPKYLGRQVPVSVMGVLSEIGSLGTVKRKSDNTEVSRRDVTIVDKSKRSVMITLWNPVAEKVSHLEPLPHRRPVLAITMCRVSDFNGLSLNTTSRSALVVNPDTDEARELQQWYESEGQNETVLPLGEGLDNSRHSGAVTKRHNFCDLHPLSIPPLEAKPQYGVVHATVTYISTEQNFFYLGNTENFKKVVEQNGKYYCEADGKEYGSAMHRYVVNLKAMDSTGECWLSVFNDQMEGILGITADELASMRTADEDAFRTTVINAQWQPHVFRIAGRSRQDLKTNELRMRHTVVALHNFSWENECRIALESIQKLL